MQSAVIQCVCQELVMRKFKWKVISYKKLQAALRCQQKLLHGEVCG